MDQVIKFYLFFGFPIIRHSTGSYRDRLPIIWCSVTLIWFTYHYTHLLGYYNVHQVYIMFTSASNRREHHANLSTAVSKLIYICVEFVWPVTVKIYLLASYLCSHKPSSTLYRHIEQLNQASGRFKDPPKRLKFWICCVLILLLVVSAVQTYQGLNVLLPCFDQSDQCSTLYLTRWIDPIGEVIETLTYTIGITFLPILASVVCLQFASCVTSITSQISLKNNAKSDLMDRLVVMFDAQTRFVTYLEGSLFCLISLFALDMIVTVSLIVRHVIQHVGYSVTCLAVEFFCISLLCYSSSRAVEAVS